MRGKAPAAPAALILSVSCSALQNFHVNLFAPAEIFETARGFS
jgi:hypothetical protein